MERPQTDIPDKNDLIQTFIVQPSRTKNRTATDLAGLSEENIALILDDVKHVNLSHVATARGIKANPISVYEPCGGEISTRPILYEYPLPTRMHDRWGAQLQLTCDICSAMMAIQADPMELWSLLLQLMLKQVNPDLPYGNYFHYEGYEGICQNIGTISLADQILRENHSGSLPRPDDEKFSLAWTFVLEMDTVNQESQLAHRLLRRLTVEQALYMKEVTLTMRRLYWGLKPMKRTTAS